MGCRPHWRKKLRSGVCSALGFGFWHLPHPDSLDAGLPWPTNQRGGGSRFGRRTPAPLSIGFAERFAFFLPRIEQFGLEGQTTGLDTLCGGELEAEAIALRTQLIGQLRLGPGQNIPVLALSARIKQQAIGFRRPTKRDSDWSRDKTIAPPPPPTPHPPPTPPPPPNTPPPHTPNGVTGVR